MRLLSLILLVVLSSTLSGFSQFRSWSQWMDSLESPSYIANEYLLDELVFQENLKDPNEAILYSFYKKEPLTKTDQIIDRLPGISSIKRGNYAWEPTIRGMQGGQVKITIDGMQILPACTDRMDPATSYVESQNLQSIALHKGNVGAINGPTIGGALDLKTKQAILGNRSKQFGAGLDYHSVSNGVNSNLSFSSSSRNFGIRSEAVFRKSDNYLDGNGEIVQYSAYEKINFLISTKHRLKKDNILVLDLIYDDAWKIGYPSLPMDVSKARGIIGSATLYLYNPLHFISEMKLKGYANDILHIMDDSDRDNPVKMDMPGSTNVQGFFVESKFNPIQNHNLFMKVEAFTSKAFADMTMYFEQEQPMYMVTWGDIRRVNTGLYLSDQWSINKNNQLIFSGRIDWNFSQLQNEQAIRQLSIFYPEMKEQYHKLSGMGSATFMGRTDSNTGYSMNVSIGQRIPNDSEQYGFYLFNAADGFDYLGNPDIQNETSIQLDAEISQKAKLMEFSLSGYFSQIDNYIMGVYDPELVTMTIGANGVKVYQNVDWAHIYGGELGLLLQDISFPVYAMIKAEYTAGIDSDSDYLPFISPFRGTFNIGYQKGGLQTSIENILSAKQDRYSKKGQEDQTPGFYLLNIRTKYTLMGEKTNYTFSAGIENLLSEYYWDHLSVNNVPGLGRNIYVGVGVNFY